LKWEYLTYTASTYNSKTKQTTQTELLHSTSGIARPGDFVAIMGPSGAGKTTLMNILSQKIRSSDTTSVGGCVYANGTPISDLVYTNYIAYVTQEDILLDTMSVREAITFSVKLRTGLDRNKIEDKVNKILKELSLVDVQNSLIGSVLIRGISGGEKKRVCIAVEIVTDPSVLFLDGNT
jgi:ABC-type multidrug transport system ATPase subunit